MRFASRFSRARLRAASKGGGVRMYSGGRPLADFGETWVFGFVGNSEKVAPGAGSPTSVSQISPSRARSEKNILAAPDGSGGPPEASGHARMFFWDRVREGAELVTG